jgi:hypothetical protein
MCYTVFDMILYRKFSLLPAIFIVFTASISPLFSQENPERAMIVYLEGEMEVHRDEMVLESEDIDIGFELETWDLLETGDDGIAELELQTPGNEGTVLTVLPETAFYFTADIEEGRKKTKFEMMKGSLGLKVAKVFNDGEVVVATQSVVAGVRGTDFTVTAAVDGSLLVTCDEGEVVCRDESGTEYSAVPGQAVESLQEGPFRVRDLRNRKAAEYRREWIESRRTRFKADAPRIISAFHPVYKKLHADFLSAFTDLAKHRDIWRKWVRYYRTGSSPKPGEASRDRAAAAPAITRMAAVSFRYEKVHFRVLEIRKYFLLYKLRDFNLKGRVTARLFLRELAKSEREIRRKMAVTRMYYKIYRYINWMAERENSS